MYVEVENKKPTKLNPKSTKFLKAFTFKVIVSNKSYANCVRIILK